MNTYRIATIGLCDPGYSEEVARIAHVQAVLEIKKSISDITDVGLQPNEQKSLAAIELLKKADAEKTFDCIFVLQVAWARPAVLLQLIRAFEHKPMVLYSPGGNIEKGIIRSIAPAAGATASIHILNRHGIPFKYVYSAPNSPVKEKDFMPFVRAAATINSLKGCKLGTVGFNDMRLQNMGFDVQEIHERLGIEIEALDLLEVKQEMEKVSDSDIRSLIDRAGKWESINQAPKPESLKSILKFHYVIEKWAQQFQMPGITIKCPTGVAKIFGFTPCMIGSMLADKYHYVCENDIPGLITQVALGKLSQQMTTYWEYYELYEQSILFGCCGFLPESFAENNKFKIRTFDGFMSGMACCSDVREGNYTIARMGKTYSGEYGIYFTHGKAEKPADWYEDAVGYPKHPSVNYYPECGVQDLMDVVMAQHVAVTPGNWVNELEEFSRLAGFEVLI